MRRKLPHRMIAAATMMMFASTAAAEPTIGMGSGFTQPFGRAFSSSGALSASMYGTLPLQLDVGYRMTPNVYVGLEGQLAVVVSRDCADRCSGEDVRLGFLAAYSFPQEGRHLIPWLGFGAGYEVLSLHQSADRVSRTISMRGFELAGVTGGVDYAALPPTGGNWRVGPFLRGSLGRYDSVSINGESMSNAGNVLHAWLTIGVRITFTP